MTDCPDNCDDCVLDDSEDPEVICIECSTKYRLEEGACVGEKIITHSSSILFVFIITTLKTCN